MTDQADTEQLSEAVARAQCDDNTAPYQQGKDQQDDDRADQPQLLAHDGEDKVILRLG